MALTKKDLIEKIAKSEELSPNQSKDVVENLIEIIKSSLESGDDVLVSGFGKFSVREKGERLGRNPATGDNVALPSRRVVSFKCSGKLRDRINGGK